MKQSGIPPSLRGDRPQGGGNHLGTIVAVTGSWMDAGPLNPYLETEGLVQRYAFDAWGRGRDPATWAGTPPAELGHVDVHRGFTGHEMLRHLGLVHMNGRVYDPITGRFLSADPFVQSPGNLQNFNRYSYVLNNPLSYTDPSGYFFKKIWEKRLGFLKKYWRPIVAIVATVVTAGWAAWAIAGFQGTFLGALGAMATGGFSAVGAFTLGQSMAIGFIGGFAGGLVGTGSLRGALMGGFAGAMAAGIGYGFENGLSDTFGRFKEVARAAAHGINGGVMSELGGGSFRAGFLGGAFGSLASHTGPQFESFGANLVKAAVVGGTAAKLGGGKFENGAISAAFQHLFNAALSASRDAFKLGAGGSERGIERAVKAWDDALMVRGENGEVPLAVEGMIKFMESELNVVRVHGRARGPTIRFNEYGALGYPIIEKGATIWINPDHARLPGYDASSHYGMMSAFAHEAVHYIRAHRGQYTSIRRIEETRTTYFENQFRHYANQTYPNARYQQRTSYRNWSVETYP